MKLRLRAELLAAGQPFNERRRRLFPREDPHVGVVVAVEKFIPQSMLVTKLREDQPDDLEPIFVLEFRLSIAFGEVLRIHRANQSVHEYVAHGGVPANFGGSDPRNLVNSDTAAACRQLVQVCRGVQMSR